MVIDNLNKGENSFRRLAENLPGIVYRVLIEDDNRMIFFNDVVQTMTGYSPEDLKKGKVCSIDPLILPEDRVNVINIVKDAIENNVPFEVEYRINNRSGELKWFFERGRPIQGDKGNPPYIDGVIFDITNQKAAEKKLKESEEKFKLLYENAPLGYQSLDSNGNILEVNKAWINFFGYSKEEVIGKWFGDFIDSEHLEVFNTRFLKLKEIGEVSGTEFEIIKKDGSHAIILLDGNVSYDETGNFNQTHCIFQDITEQKQIQIKLQEGEKLLKNAQELAQIGHWKLDPSTMEVTGSDELFRIFGLTHDEATFEKFADVVHPDDREMNLFHIRRGMEKGESWDIEHRVISKDGKEKWVKALGEAIKNDNGKIIMLIGTVQDITMRKKMMEELRVKDIVFNASLSAQSTSDINGIIDHVNPAFLELLGYKSNEEAIGNSVGSFFANPDDAVPILEALNKTGKWEGEFFAKRCDGSTFISQGFASAIFNENGDMIGYQLANLNITKRKEADEKLKESEASYRHLSNELEVILDHIPGIVVYKDTENNILRVNKFLADAHNLKKADMENRSSFDFYPRDIAQAYWEDDLEVIKSKLPKINIVEPWETDAGTRWVNTSKIPYIDENSNVKGIIAIAFDITERMLAEQKLKSEKEKAQKYLDIAGVIIVALNADQTVQLINQKGCEILREEESEIIGMNWFDNYIPENVREQVKKDFNRILSGEIEPLENYENAVITKNGKKRIIAWHNHILKNKAGQIIGTLSSGLDITERKQAERELQLERDNFLNIFNSMEDRVYIVNQNYDIEFVNPSFIKEFRQFEGMKCYKYFEDRNEICPRCKNKEIFQGKTVRGEWFSFKNKKTYDVIDTPLKNPDGSISKLGIFRDETDKKQAEAKLKESEKNFRKQSLFLNNILESLTHPFYVINVKDYTIALANITASSEGLELGQYCYSLTHNNDKPCEAPCKCPIDEVKKTKRACVVEHSHYDKEGNEKIYEIYGYPILDESGNVVQMIEYALNISDRKKAEQKLIESEEKFRTIAERTLMGILILQDNQVKYINEALLNLFEYSQNEILNWETDDLTKLIHLEDLSIFREYLEHLRSGDKSYKPYYSYRVYTKSGKIKWIDQFSKEIQYKGRSAELVTIIDITEKKEAEQELIKLHNMKSELLRRTSHELKTPLVSIKGFSDLLLELHRNKLDDYVIRTIEQIRRGCNRLESLVNDMLKTSELESGTIELKKSKEDLSLLIKICVSELEGLSELRNHTIKLEISDNLICSFEKKQIYNVISNILSNAIKYTPYNGKIEVKSEINNSFIIISIKDNGLGFTEEEKTQIFKQFGKIERYGQGYDVISEGLGLGLYISKKIVELHSGEIWVESEGRDEGSTFYFSLPIA